MEDELYREGFNAGFVLEEKRPDLAKIFISAEGNSVFLQGIKDGRREYQLEKELEQLDELEQLRLRGKDRDKGLER